MSENTAYTIRVAETLDKPMIAAIIATCNDAAPLDFPYALDKPEFSTEEHDIAIIGPTHQPVHLTLRAHAAPSGYARDLVVALKKLTETYPALRFLVHERCVDPGDNDQLTIISNSDTHTFDCLPDSTPVLSAGELDNAHFNDTLDEFVSEFLDTLRPFLD